MSGAWRIMAVSKQLATMVIVSPQDLGLLSFLNGLFMANKWGGVILTTY